MLHRYFRCGRFTPGNRYGHPNSVHSVHSAHSIQFDSPIHSRRSVQLPIYHSLFDFGTLSVRLLVRQIRYHSVLANSLQSAGTFRFSGSLAQRFVPLSRYSRFGRLIRLGAVLSSLTIHSGRALLSIRGHTLTYLVLSIYAVHYNVTLPSGSPNSFCSFDTLSR